ncbi:MAG: 3-dehydroquinate synthase [Acidobacteria bacterium]|nr:3-dehydroquinate synthase [Acidobacteriota bacterium]
MREKIISWKLHKTKIHFCAEIENLNFESGKQQLMIVDKSVLQLHRHRLPRIPAIPITADEKQKTMETVNFIYKRFTELNADRNTFVWCVGGGITTDTAAFATSTYMRGMPFALVPTTLLGQVDAAIGGKCGVNFKGFKNLIGTFSHPENLVLDYHFLQTLPDREIRNGIAEIIKHAAIRDTLLFEQLESFDGFLNKFKSAEPECAALIEKSISIKLDIVIQDEKEAGERKLLNFGHTFGHAIEAVSGLSHGESVAAGMVLAGRLSEKMGILTQNETERIIRLLSRYRLPVQNPVSPESLLAALWHDKKKNKDRIEVILLAGIGNAVRKFVPIRQLESFLHDLR